MVQTCKLTLECVHVLTCRLILQLSIDKVCSFGSRLVLVPVFVLEEYWHISKFQSYSFISRFSFLYVNEPGRDTFYVPKLSMYNRILKSMAESRNFINLHD